MAVHPSGKLAVSIAAKDKSLRLWNLVSGKAAGKAKSPLPFERVFWSPSGDKYALQCEAAIYVYAASNTSKPLAELQRPSKILTALFLDDDRLAYAGEGSELTIATFMGAPAKRVDLKQKPRIKALNRIRDILVSVASEGSLCFWDISKLGDETVKPLATHTIPGLRPICMSSTAL